ncbi:uncharacterized protein BXZ73DRAFT_104158 [Epithele typhae]|uniref:uncharacterized protein n=1 Tax=Epithele typhae TaxID=378194 RepID=UPI002008692B|nr:uncharacterized protein BXZ73DRAFT_104158 [Epithele typhae]KAH9922339.1 hypothetical protein BXZ73DRAFT_104158 [Epithele typhae]
MYKSSNYRKQQPPSDSPTDRFRPQAKQLLEAFPTWSYDDIQSLLVEVNGDVTLASTQILEGHAEQWGSVTRKKDKKSTPTASYNKDASSARDRGEFRGGRGGRAARGGPRGGAARGASARGGHHEVNGHRTKPSLTGQDDKDHVAPDAAAPLTTDGGAPDADADTSAWGWSTPPTWGGDTAVLNGSTHPPAAVPVAAPVAAASPPTQAPAPIAAKVVTKPATSKLSWAQIASKPQEKPTPPPAPTPAPAPAHTPAPAPVSAPQPASVPTPPPASTQPEPSPPAEPTEIIAPSTGWEEPTTVQAPTWDDEPRAPPPAEAPVAVDEAAPIAPETTTAEEPPIEPSAPAVPPGVGPPAVPTVSPAVPPAKPLTPSASSRPTPISHRATKFKTTDQPVVLPASFGSGIEKIGMQFGSLSLGGEDLDAPIHEVVPEPIPAQSEPSPVPAPIVQAQEPAAPVASPPSQPSLASVALFQPSVSQPAQQPPAQPAPQQPPHLPPVVQQPPSNVPSSLSTPSLTTQTSLPSSATTSAISPYSQQSQPALASHQSQQGHLPYGLQTHLEQVQSQQQHSTPQQQQQQQQPAQGGPSSYFRQAEAPYFHTPTPPAGQSQESPYGAFGQQLGQHQGQGQHLGNFSQDYGYSQNRDSFYESYSGPGTFGNRNVLGHDDQIKGIPGSQQPGLPPTGNAQSSQQQQQPQPSQGSQGSQPAGQGPQQGYPPPLPPYYYQPYPQSQYYGTPYNSGYSVPQPFVKYPAVFQGPAGKQAPGVGAGMGGPTQVQHQPQSPYAQTGLYGHGQQPHSNAYDDPAGLGGYGAHQHQHHSHSLAGQNAYGKHGHQGLYGSGGSVQGMQGFMGRLPDAAPRAAAGSPENAYKPYGGNVGGVKDVGTAGVGQGGVGQGPQGGRVQPQGQSAFYAQRARRVTWVPPGGLGRQRFYSYQPRQQQGYWQ